MAAETGGSLRGIKSPKPIVVSEIIIKYMESSIDQSSTQLKINVGMTIRNPDPYTMYKTDTIFDDIRFFFLYQSFWLGWQQYALLTRGEAGSAQICSTWFCHNFFRLQAITINFWYVVSDDPAKSGH